MGRELNPMKQECQNTTVRYQGGSDTMYALGLIGAWVYYIGRATTNQERVVGFFKGLVWPAFFVYEAFKFLERMGNVGAPKKEAAKDMLPTENSE